MERKIESRTVNACCMNLLLCEVWYHRGRIALATLATTAMSCLIVWFVGSLDLMMLRFDEDAENYLGHYHLALIPDAENSPGVSQRISRNVFPMSVIDELRADGLVVEVTPARQIRCVMGQMRHANDELAAVRRQRSITGLPTLSPALIAIESTESPFELEEGRWFSDAYEGVMGTGAAESLQEFGGERSEPVKVGDTVICRVGTSDFKIRIVGLFEQKLASGSRSVDPVAGAVFVSPQTAEVLQPTPQPTTQSGIDYVYVRLREGVNTKPFKQFWTQHFQDNNLSLRFLDVDDIQAKLNRIRAQDTSPLMGGVASQSSILFFSTLVSVLIVFTALSMGVSERARFFAMLRTIGMSRRGVAGLVFGESVILCVLGWVGGVLAGWLVLQISVWREPEFYGVGKTVSLGLKPLLTAGVAALTGSLFAAVLPAWRATRISPMDGMNRQFLHEIKHRRFVFLALVGVPLLLIAPTIIYYPPGGEAASLRQLLYVTLGLPTQIAGFLLLTPLAILGVDKFGTPFVATVLRLPRTLLGSQLAAHYWATLGTTVALGVGLGTYSFMEIAGYSMLVPYLPSQKMPHTVAAVIPFGIPSESLDSVQKLPGVDSERFLPLAVDQSLFSPRQTEHFLNRGLAPMQASAVMFGLDMEKAFKKTRGDRPLIDVDFKEGTLEQALERMRSGGRFCLVPDSFALRCDLHVGDRLELVLPDKNIIEYEICGVVSMPGWLWMNKTSGVRKRGYRSGAMLLAPWETVKNDYGISDIEFFWFDRMLDSSGKPLVSDTELEASLQRFAKQHTVVEPAARTAEQRSMVKISSREYLRGQVGNRADQVIQAAAKMPLMMLAIASFGMLGTVAASVRTRRYEFGVLRSLGVTRSELARLILAEAILMALAVIVLSVGFGVLGGWCFIGLMRYLSIFGGFTSPLVIPLGRLMLGFSVTLVLCFFAALGPAVVAGRTEPTKLLSEH